MAETSPRRSVTPRGFTIFDEFTDSYGNKIRVQESSNAMGPHVWIFAEHQRDYLKPEEKALFAAHGIDPGELAARLSPAPHLTPGEAARMRDALDAFINEVQETQQAEGLAAADLDDWQQ
jgi:hypothetical protein